MQTKPINKCRHGKPLKQCETCEIQELNLKISRLRSRLRKVKKYTLDRWVSPVMWNELEKELK